METTARGRSYVTARGWEDLSEIITMYEEDGLVVDETLVSQYLQNEKIVREFCAYYDLYNKYKSDYKIEALLSGGISDSIIMKAKKAPIDERLSLLGMLIDKIQVEMKDCMETSDFLKELMLPLRTIKGENTSAESIEKQISARKAVISKLERANALSDYDRRKHKRIIAFLNEAKKEPMESEEASSAEGANSFARLEQKFNERVTALKDEVAHTGSRLHNLFEFVNEAFEDGNEMLIFVTELTVNAYSARYISSFGSEDYQKYNKILMISERQNTMKEDISKLNLEI